MSTRTTNSKLYLAFQPKYKGLTILELSASSYKTFLPLQQKKKNVSLLGQRLKGSGIIYFRRSYSEIRTCVFFNPIQIITNARSNCRFCGPNASNCAYNSQQKQLQRIRVFLYDGTT